MNMPTDKALVLIKDGNKYLLYFLSIFIFVHFAIIIPFKHHINNSAIGEASKSIDKQLNYLNNSIATLEKVRDSLSQTKDTSKFLKGGLINNIRELKVSNTNFDSIGFIAQKIYSLQEKRFSYQKELITLSEKRDERSYNIPILGISINESIILSIYPGFILVGLCLALIYRSRVLQLLFQLTNDKRKKISFPIWLAPIPLSLRQDSFIAWAFINTIGLACHFLIIYVGVDFLFFNYRGNNFEFEILAVNIFIALSALSVYSITIIQLFITEWKRIER
jgi:hypothetical protein